MTTSSLFRLPFKCNRIAELAAEYVRTNRDQSLEEELMRQMPAARTSGVLERPLFVKVCAWKSKRPRAHAEKNTPKRIEEAWRLAWATNDEYLRLRVLTLLSGVQARTASALLHLGTIDLEAQQAYPLLDDRALETLGVDQNARQYSYNTWAEYVKFCRQTARRCRVDLRTLDRALWQWSKRGGRE